MFTQNIQVLGERNPNDKLNNINLTRSVRLNDLTQKEMAKLYRRGQTNVTTGSLNQGFDFEYLFESNTYNVSLDVVAITFDSETQAVVFDCGYSAVYNRYFRVLLTKGTDGTYSWSQRITAPTWVVESDLKTINGESLVGEGNIEIKGGSDGNIITINYGKDNRNIEAYKLLYNYTPKANNAVSVNLQLSLWLYAATNIWTSESEKRIYFDIFFLGDLSNRRLSNSRFYLTEDGTCSMESNDLLSVPTLMGEDVSDIRLKSINGVSIVGDGEITVGGGSTAAYVYFRLQNSESIMEWRDNLEDCNIYMPTFLDSNDDMTTTLSCYCKVQEDNAYQLVPFSICRGENGNFHIYLTAYCSNEWRRYDISASSWQSLQYSPTINYTTIN